MFPDAKHPPAMTAKRFGDEAIPAAIARQLFLPICPIASWRFGMFGASMPKTTVHKDNQLVSAKGKVGLAENGKMSSPASDFILS